MDDQDLRSRLIAAKSGDGRRSRAATMRDVAAAAGVAVSTVSKVLSGADISVRSETRARIEQAASDLRYRPNATARGLRLARTGAFGMLVPDFTNPVYATIVRGAVREAEAIGRVTLLAELDGDHSPAGYVRLAREGRIDGLLIATARTRSPLLAELERGDGVPHVFVNRRGGADSLSVVLDDEEGAAVGTRALVDAGHTRLGLILGPEDVETSQRRRNGFEQVRRQRGLPEASVVWTEYSVSGGYEAAKRLLEGERRPTGVLLTTMTIALGALGAFADSGVRVPEDISVVGYDDGELATVTHPPLTSVATALDELGGTAVRVLEAVLRGEPAVSCVVPTPPRLMRRASLAPPGRSVSPG